MSEVRNEVMSETKKPKLKNECNNVELLRCPFCGGEAKIMNNVCATKKFDVGCINNALNKDCNSCGFVAERFKTREDAINAWNRRHPAAPQWTSVTPRIPGLYLCKLRHLERIILADIFISEDGYELVRYEGNVRLLHEFSGEIKNGQHVINCLNLWLKLAVPPLPTEKEATK